MDHTKKVLINIQNFDHNQTFKWFLIRYLHSTDHHPARIRKTDRTFERKLDFKDIKFPVKIRDCHKIEKRIASALVFLVMKTRENIQSMYQKILLKNMLI